MDRDRYAADILPLPASGWASWVPELTEAPDRVTDETPVAWWSAGVSLAMWSCASLLAVLYS